MVILSNHVFYSKNCHSKNFGTRDLRQANLPHTPKDLSPSPPRAAATSPTSPQRRVVSPPPSPSKPSPPPSASSRPLFPSLTINRKDTGAFGDSTSSPGPLLRPTRVLSPTRGAFNLESEQIDDTDSTTDQGSDDSQFTPSHVGRSDNGLPRTVPLAGTGTSDRVPSPTKPTVHAPTSTGSLAALGRANSLSGNGAIGARRIAPLAASTTGTRYGAALMGELRSTPTGSPVRQWGGGTPQCPRCNKNVYFAEQVRTLRWFSTSHFSSQLVGIEKKNSGESCWQDVAQSVSSLLGVWHVPRFQPSHGERWGSFLPSVLQQGLYFSYQGLSYHSLTLTHECSCMARLGVGMPSWEKQVAET
jgi:hypothetical protein